MKFYEPKMDFYESKSELLSNMIKARDTRRKTLPAGLYNNKLWPIESSLKGKEDAANNFAKGHYTIGKNIAALFGGVDQLAQQTVPYFKNMSGKGVNYPSFQSYLSKRGKNKMTIQDENNKAYFYARTLAGAEAEAYGETPKEIAAANKQFHANRNYFEPLAPSLLQDEYNMARMAILQARTHLDMLSQKTRQIDLEEEMWKQAFVVGYKRLQAAQAAGTFHDGQLQAVDRASPSQLAQESNFWPVGDFRIPSKALAERLSRRMVAKAGRVDRKIDFSSPPTDKGFGFIKSTNPSFSFALKQYYLDRKRLTGRSKCLECQDLIKKFGLPAGVDVEIKI